MLLRTPLKQVLFAAAGVMVTIGLAAAHDHEEFQVTMKSTAANFASLRKTVEAKQGPETAAAAEKLVPLYKQVLAHFEEHKMQDGITLAKTGQEASANLAAAAKAGDWDKAAAELKTIGGTCQSCHTAHREKLADGTYKMKMRLSWPPELGHNQNNTPDWGGHMKRRDWLAALGAAAVVGTAVEADAQTSAEMHPPKYKPLEESTAKCVSTGEDCLRHCLAMMAMKDTSMAACADSIVQLVAACRALQTLAAVNSKFTPAFAKTVALVCANCDSECRKFYDKYAVCKACADACVACATGCKKVA